MISQYAASVPCRFRSLLHSLFTWTSDFIRSLYPQGVCPPSYIHFFIVGAVLFSIPLAFLTIAVATSIITSSTHQTTVSLPDPATFEKNNGTKWHIEYVGDIQFTGAMEAQGLGGDKCRSSILGGQHIWNCGDMTCGVLAVCGFNMGPAFYGTTDVRTINTSAHGNIGDYEFASPWHGDPKPVSPQFAYGMDTSNVAAVNDTTGIAYVWEITRGTADVAAVDHGAGVVAVTLGDTQPIATRLGPLLTGADSVQLGLLAIMRVDEYIYNYNQQGPTGNIIVGRVEAGDAAFDPGRYEYLTFGTVNTPTWIPGIPSTTNVTSYGMRSADYGGRFACQQYGSVFWNNYFGRYMLMCTLYMDFTFFYLASNPWGPWSTGYKLLDKSGRPGYGVSAHPSYSPGNDHRELYFSQGPNGPFNMFRVTFYY